MTSKEHQEWVIQKLNEDYTKRLEECNKIIEQQRILIEQQKELIDKLLIKVNDDNRIVIPVEKQVPDYTKYPTITWEYASSTDTKGE